MYGSRAYELSIKKVLLDHDDVDCLWIFEREEAEAARATSGAITHDLTVDDFAKLREVVFERFCYMYLVWPE